jgi:hypothetical protein
LCTPSDLVCSRLSETITTPAEFCTLSGYLAVPDEEGSPCFDGTPGAASRPPGKKGAKKPAKARDTSSSSVWNLQALQASFRPWKKWASRLHLRFVNFISRQTQTNSGLFMLFVVGQMFALVCMRICRFFVRPSSGTPQAQPIPEVRARKGRAFDGLGVD